MKSSKGFLYLIIVVSLVALLIGTPRTPHKKVDLATFEKNMALFEKRHPEITSYFILPHLAKKFLSKGQNDKLLKKTAGRSLIRVKKRNCRPPCQKVDIMCLSESASQKRLPAGGDAMMNIADCSMFLQAVTCKELNISGGVQSVSSLDAKLSKNLEDPAEACLVRHELDHAKANTCTTPPCKMENLGYFTSESCLKNAHDKNCPIGTLSLGCMALEGSICEGGALSLYNLCQLSSDTKSCNSCQGCQKKAEDYEKSCRKTFGLEAEPTEEVRQLSCLYCQLDVAPQDRGTEYHDNCEITPTPTAQAQPPTAVPSLPPSATPSPVPIPTIAQESKDPCLSGIATKCSGTVAQAHICQCYAAGAPRNSPWSGGYSLSEPYRSCLCTKGDLTEHLTEVETCLSTVFPQGFTEAAKEQIYHGLNESASAANDTWGKACG